MKNAPLYLNWRNGAKIHGEQMKIKLRLYLICQKSMVNKLEKAAGVPKVNSCFTCLLPLTIPHLGTETGFLEVVPWVPRSSCQCQGWQTASKTNNAAWSIPLEND